MLADLIRSILHNTGPIYYEPGKRTAALAASLVDEAFAAITLLWPNLAITVKRVRDIGIQVRYYVVAYIALTVLVIAAPRVGIAFAFGALLAAIFTPTGSVERFMPRRRDR